jgi:GntR family transcriptional regulator/MocR family aminotransferase
MTENQSNLGWDVLLDVDRTAGGPLHERLKHAVRSAIGGGRLRAGDSLPPSRKLASDLRCSRWVVTEAYAQLAAEGFLDARSGSATRVRWSHDLAVQPPVPAAPPTPASRFDLSPGLPDLRAFPRNRWAAAIRSAITSAATADLAYVSPAGHPALRHVLAAYLERCRGASVGPDDVTICTSVSQGVMRTCRALLAAGITDIALEDPGWPRLRQIARATGMTTVPIRVDEQGLCVDDLRAHPTVRAVLTTPAHQFPHGTVLSAARRASLLRWARDVDGVILEDDYDAEFRYDGRPIGTLQGMDPSQVILLKSLSKTMSPALGIGWLVAPARWADVMNRDEWPASTPPTLDQLAFSSVLESGAYDRHLRASRQRYRARRDALVRALAEHLPDAAVSGIAAGMHLVVRLPPGVDATRVIAGAAARGVRTTALDAFRFQPGQPGDQLVLGYGNIPDGAVVGAVVELAAAVHAAA